MLELVRRYRTLPDGHRRGTGEPVLVVRRGTGSARAPCVRSNGGIVRPGCSAHRSTRASAGRRAVPSLRRTEAQLPRTRPGRTRRGPPRSCTPSTPRILTAIDSMNFELCGRADRVLDVRAYVRSSVIASLAMIGIGALVIAPVAPPPQPHAPSTVSREVSGGCPALGAIPLAFIRNHPQYCAHSACSPCRALITVPIAAVQTPATFLGSLASTGQSPQGDRRRRGVGHRPGECRRRHRLHQQRRVPRGAEGISRSTSRLSRCSTPRPGRPAPGEFFKQCRTASGPTFSMTNQPVGPPTTPGRAPRTSCRFSPSSAINVTTAVAFQAGEPCSRAWCRSRRRGSGTGAVR